MRKHTTGWEDARMAEVFCDGERVGTIDAEHDEYNDEPWVCDRCGAVLRLIWDVRIEEVPRTAPEQVQEPVNQPSVSDGDDPTL